MEGEMTLTVGAELHPVAAVTDLTVTVSWDRGPAGLAESQTLGEIGSLDGHRPTVTIAGFGCGFSDEAYRAALTAQPH